MYTYKKILAVNHKRPYFSKDIFIKVIALIKPNGSYSFMFDFSCTSYFQGRFWIINSVIQTAHQMLFYAWRSKTHAITLSLKDSEYLMNVNKLCEIHNKCIISKRIFWARVANDNTIPIRMIERTNWKSSITLSIISQNHVFTPTQYHYRSFNSLMCTCALIVRVYSFY